MAYMETLAVRYAAKPGYELRSVVVDGVEVADSYPAAYWFGNVNANHRIHVVYRPMETGVTVNYYRDTVGPGNLLGTYRATARVDDRFVVPPRAIRMVRALRTPSWFLPTHRATLSAWSTPGAQTWTM